MPPSRALVMALVPALGFLAAATPDTLNGIGVGVARDEGRAQFVDGAPSPSPPAKPSSVPDYDEPPRPIKIVKPRYPPKAFAKKIEGTVELEILIDAKGLVARARILKSVPGLDQAALETVHQWRFSPAVKNGRPVATIALAPVIFRIDAKPTPTPRP